VNFGAGQLPMYAVAGDFNGDGHIDLAVTNFGGGNVSILLGNRDGTFGPPNFAAGRSPEYIAMADLNGDGKLDLAVGDSSAGTVLVLFGNGDGKFKTATALSTGGANTSGIAIADFNGDGKPDIVAADSATSKVTVLLGNGKGSFQSAITSPVGNGLVSGPFALATGDLNGDGKLDVAVVASSLQDVALLPGLGNGKFGTATFLGADAAPAGIAATQLRAGKLDDLVVVDSERNLVSVLRNTAK